MDSRLKQFAVYLAMCAGLLIAAPLPAAAAEPLVLTYPGIYRSHNLPELSDATVISTGRQTSSLRDGIRIRLLSHQSISDVRNFYRNAMAGRGWKEYDSPAVQAARNNPRLAVLTFTKDRMTYNVTITASSNAEGTQVMINVVER